MKPSAVQSFDTRQQLDLTDKEKEYSEFSMSLSTILIFLRETEKLKTEIKHHTFSSNQMNDCVIKPSPLPIDNCLPRPHMDFPR